jgi:protocatechuate 3,4-dioxygenase beta subunit
MWIHLLLLPSLAGTVVDGKNRPIEGASVVLIPGGFAAGPTTGTTDASGRFEIPLPKAGSYRVEAYARGYAPFRLKDVDRGKPLAIVLLPGVALEGVVRDGTTMDPIEGAIVETRNAEGLSRISSEPRVGFVEGVSDERGKFRLEGLGQQEYSVTASAPGYGRTTIHNRSPGEAVELYLFPGSGIYGRLLDEKGSPVAGALVSGDEHSFKSAPITAQTTDSDGRFAFLGLDPGEYRIFVSHESFAPVAHDLELKKESDAEIELVLTRGVLLTGHLVNENKEAVTGKVSMRSLDGGTVGLTIRSRLTAETDAEGSFAIGPVPPGDHVFLVESRGYGSKNVEASVSGREKEEDLGDIVLETGLTISGKVVDEGGDPVFGGVVNASLPARGALSATGDSLVVAETDEQGRFVLAGLSPGAHSVNATAPGYGLSDFVMLEPGASNVTFTLKRAGSIRGTVVDLEGKAVTSFHVVARSSDHQGNSNAGVQDMEGTFVLDSVAEGEYAVEITSRDLLPEAVSAVRVSSGNVTEVGTIRLRRGGGVVGRVVDGSSDPVPGATIQGIVAGPRRFLWMDDGGTVSDRSGRFEIKGLPDGKCTVVATHPSYAVTTLKGVEIDSSAGFPEVEVVLRRGGALEGMVRTRDGTDVAGRTIEIHPEGAAMTASEFQTARTAEDGSFRMEHLPVGKLMASLQQSEVDARVTIQSREVEIVEGETAYVEFQPRPVLIQGQLKKGGSPLSGVEIELYPDTYSSMSYGSVSVGRPPVSGPRYLVGMSGDDGYYELFVGEPGEYTVSASAYGVGLPSRRVTIPDVEAFTFDIDFGSALLSGRVIDKETEAPVPGAFVIARPSKASIGDSAAGLRVGSDGLFELSLDPGEFTLVVRANGYGTLEKRVTVEDGGRSDLVLALSSGLRITGRVLDANGRGIGNVRVAAVVDSPDLMTVPARMGSTMTIPDGSFSLEDLASGRYNVLVRDDHLGFAFLPSVPSGTENLELVLSPGGEVEVLVVDSQGAPVPNAIVALAGIEGRKVRGIQGTADANGRLDLPAPRGNLTIKAALMNGPEAMGTVSLTENATARVEIVLAQAASNLSKK